MLTFLASPIRTSFLLALLLSAFSCASAPAPKPEIPAAEPPAQSPPAHASASERLEWWNTRLPGMAAADRSEAQLHMGWLEIELAQFREARLDFYASLGGPLSQEEMALAECGIAFSYFGEKQGGYGISHLDKALPHLDGPRREEAAFLIAWHNGESPTAAPAVFARLKPFLNGVAAAGPIAPSGTQADFGTLARSAWRARSMRANYDPMGNPTRITLHHTAEPMSSTRMSESVAELRRVQAEHMDRGWADIGYHFLIDRAGRVFEGRDIKAQGAHAGNKQLNRNNIGICLLGNFANQLDRGSEYRAQKPSAKQLSALKALLDDLRQAYGIRGNMIYGHAELKQTECPGVLMSSWLNRYQREL